MKVKVRKKKGSIPEGMIIGTGTGAITFLGEMKVQTLPGILYPEIIFGKWTYVPWGDFWYCNGETYPAAACVPVRG